ncbi:alpha/beta hydrolase [Tropicimonas sp. IMCC6043]|nr:alpha/beta hydrolase [Tropicimonas sp. IMCC6043]
MSKREDAVLVDSKDARSELQVSRSPAGFTRRALLASLAASAATACSAPRHFVGVGPASEVAGRSHTIYIATVRAPATDPTVFFSGERSPRINFATVNVHIPPNHVIGQLELPRSLPPDPERHFVIKDPQILDEAGFRSVVGADARSRPRGQRDALMWIHGFNTTLSEAILRLAQFVEDTEYSGVPLLFSWASDARITSYVYDINSALIARDAISYVASALGRSSFDKVDIVAHSMGNLLAMEAIRGGSQLNLFDSTGKLASVVLAAPDIDYELFAAQVSSIPPESRGFFVLISSDDRALRLSGLIARRPRVGDIDAGGVRQIRTSLRKGRTAVPYAAPS